MGHVWGVYRKRFVQRLGAVAQLGERLNRIQEVVGSIPSSSTFCPPSSPFFRLGIAVAPDIFLLYASAWLCERRSLL